MTQKELAEEKLKGMLEAVQLPVKATYHPGEVCRVLGVSERTFRRLISQFERDEDGRLRRPDCLDSFTLGIQRRVRYNELVEFLLRNNTYERRHAVHPDQLDLFPTLPLTS